MIEKIIIILAFGLVSYGLGYIVGYRHCFDYLKSELEKMKENKS